MYNGTIKRKRKNKIPKRNYDRSISRLYSYAKRKFPTNEWCNNSIFDEETKQELLTIKDNKEEIKDRFYKDLEFGTAGLRGVIGIGTNRMNKYTVTKATQGLANFIIKENTQNKGVAISYDSRNMSKEFSEETALCLNANGIKTYIFDELRPVPELSFAVRKLRMRSRSDDYSKS